MSGRTSSSTTLEWRTSRSGGIAHDKQVSTFSFSSPSKGRGFKFNAAESVSNVVVPSFERRYPPFVSLHSRPKIESLARLSVGRTQVIPLKIPETSAPPTMSILPEERKEVEQHNLVEETYEARKERARVALSKSANQADSRALEILSRESELPWIHFSPKAHKSISNFVTTFPPSSIQQSDVAWISVDNSRKKPAVGGATHDIPVLCEAWDNKCDNNEATSVVLDQLARQFNILSGKWLVFASPDDADDLWSRIARATHAGTLGTSAKVSPCNDSSHVICIFTEDYTNGADVNRVRRGLERLGVKGKIGYKPDIYTYCRIYIGNQWDISPTRYHT